MGVWLVTFITARDIAENFEELFPRRMMAFHETETSSKIVQLL
jgi:hypothetical protein